MSVVLDDGSWDTVGNIDLRAANLLVSFSFISVLPFVSQFFLLWRVSGNSEIPSFFTKQNRPYTL